MGDIWFTSDLHFNHDKDFIWGARGYSSVDEMNRIQIEKFNSVVMPDDDVYILGDSMMGDAVTSQKLFARLQGKIHIILGNHDTNARAEFYRGLPQVVEVVYATVIKKSKKSFYLSHYPTMTTNQGRLEGQAINISGHTHSTDKFENIEYGVYNVAVDAHDGYPVNIETIISDLHKKLSKENK